MELGAPAVFADLGSVLLDPVLEGVGELEGLDPLLGRLEHFLLLVGQLEVELGQFQKARVFVLLVILGQVVLEKRLAVQDLPVRDRRHVLGPSTRRVSALLGQPAPLLFSPSPEKKKGE